ncbi:MAG: helix-turn-helix transcriptional regulator [Oscillospiraceae bacterium]|nr:helix-turn-helix transcriptional regulator [Oscillospiraceae bacterium]
MYEQYINIYQKSRNAKGYTQEKAAELLDISLESLKAYENDRTIPKPETVARMIEIYGDPKLGIRHARLALAALSEYLPDPEYIDNPYEAKVKLGWLAEWASEERDRIDGILQDETLTGEQRRERFREGKKKYAAS